MHTKAIITIIAATLAAGAAFAQSTNASADDAQLPQKTRAEVIADLEIYIQSGLRDLEMNDSPDFGGQRHQAARARYDALRRAPAFAARVREIGKHSDETVWVSKAVDDAPTR